MSNKENGEKFALDKTYSFKTSRVFIKVVDEVKEYLNMSESELLREALKEYIENHLPKETEEKILKKAGWERKDEEKVD